MMRLSCYCLLVLTLLATCSAPSRRDTGVRVSLTAPDSLVVGQPLRIWLRADHLTPGRPLSLVWQTAWGPRLLEPTIASPAGQWLSLPAAWTQRSGVASLRIWHQGRLLASHAIRLVPLPTAPPLDLYLGSKAIVASPRYWSMLTAIPADRLLNPVADHTPVLIDMLRPNDSRQRINTETRNLVAYQRITAQTKAGKTMVGITVDGIAGKEKELLEVPDFPLDFTIQTAAFTPIADQRQVFRVRTSVLTDRNRNVVSDGTLVKFRCEDPDGTIRQVSGYTLRGVAEVALENPGWSGRLRLSASVFGSARSNQLVLDFPTSITGLPVWIDAASRVVQIGPITETLGQLAPNGLPIRVYIDYRPALALELTGGMARVDLSGLAPGQHRLLIEAQGMATDLTITLK